MESAKFYIVHVVQKKNENELFTRSASSIQHNNF